MHMIKNTYNNNIVINKTIIIKMVSLVTLSDNISLLSILSTLREPCGIKFDRNKLDVKILKHKTVLCVLLSISYYNLCVCALIH